MNLETVLPDGIVRDQKHIATVVHLFSGPANRRDIHPALQFWHRRHAAMIAKALCRAYALVGAADEAPLADGSRLRDSLCGMMATSGVLHGLRVPFTYIENCRIDDEPFGEGVDRFVRAARVVKTLKTMRIGQIGQRIDFFWSTIANESDLLERFNIQILPIDLVNLIRRIRDRTRRKSQAVSKELAQFRQWISFDRYCNEDDILINFALRDLYIETKREHDLDGLCMQTFSSIQNELGHHPRARGVPCGRCGLSSTPSRTFTARSAPCWSRRHARATSRRSCRTLRSGIRRTTTRCCCGMAVLPLSLREPNSQLKIGVPWTLKGLPPGCPHFKLKDGPLTVCRFAGDSGGYRLGCGEGHTVPGPYTQGVLRVDGGERLARLGTAIDTGTVHPSRFLLLRSSRGCAGGGGEVQIPISAIQTFWPLPKGTLNGSESLFDLYSRRSEGA